MHAPSKTWRRARADGDAKAFRAYRAKERVIAVRFGCLQPLCLIPPFILADFELVPGRHFAAVQVLRAVSLAASGALFSLTYLRPKLVQAWGEQLWALLMLVVFLFVAALTWAHEGYASSYAWGFIFLFYGTVISMNWSTEKAAALWLFAYFIYFLPALLGRVTFTWSGVTVLHQLALFGSFLQTLVLTYYRHGASYREFSATCSLEEANGSLREFDAKKDRFLGEVSHELRTPLALIVGPIESALRQVKERRVAEKLQVALSNQRRLMHQLDKLFYFSRRNDKMMASRYAPRDLGEALRDVVLAARPMVEKKGLELRAALPTEPVRVYVDSDRFDGAVVNLINNAFKFTTRGAITVSLSVEGNHAVVEVSDTGCGIPEDKHAAIFDRFVQVNASEVRQGMGIGLSLVKEHVDRHGGRITVKSTPGEGSTFALWFPLGRAHLPAHEVSETEASPRADRYEPAFEYDDEATEKLPLGGGTQAAPKPEQGAALVPVRVKSDPESLRLLNASMSESQGTLLQGAKVLIVEDTADMRRHLRSELGELYDVYTAREGEEGLRVARAIQPDLILSDMRMAPMDGGALCKAIRQEEGLLGQTPIIMLTAEGDVGTRLELLAFGADDYLIKANAPLEEMHLRVRNQILRFRQARALLAAHCKLAESHNLVSAQQRAIHRDLTEARRFQQALLGTSASLAGFEAAVRHVPTTEVSGDFFHVVPLGAGRTRLMVFDVTDHGMGAAMRATALWVEYSLIDHANTTPGEVLRRLNDIACRKYLDLTGCAFCADFERHADHATVTYAQGGEAPFLRYTPSGIAHGEAPEDFILGMVDGSTFMEKTVRLEPGEVFLAFTDGVFNQLNEGGKPSSAYITDAFWQRALAKDGLAEGLDTIVASLDVYRGSRERMDDVLLVALRLDGSGQDASVAQGGGAAKV